MAGLGFALQAAKGAPFVVPAGLPGRLPERRKDRNPEEICREMDGDRPLLPFEPCLAASHSLPRDANQGEGAMAHDREAEARPGPNAPYSPN